MAARYVRCEKKEKFYTVNIDTFIERLKKVRALNCDPSDIGIDSLVWKKMLNSRITSAARF